MSMSVLPCGGVRRARHASVGLVPVEVGRRPELDLDHGPGDGAVRQPALPGLEVEVDAVVVGGGDPPGQRAARRPWSTHEPADVAPPVPRQRQRPVDARRGRPRGCTAARPARRRRRARRTPAGRRPRSGPGSRPSRRRRAPARCAGGPRRGPPRPRGRGGRRARPAPAARGSGHGPPGLRRAGRTDPPASGWEVDDGRRTWRSFRVRRGGRRTASGWGGGGAQRKPCRRRRNQLRDTD